MRKSLFNVVILFLSLSGFAFILVYLCTMMPGKGTLKTLPELTLVQLDLSERLKAHVEKLAGEIGERHYQVPKAYAAAAKYIETVFIENKLTPYLETFGDKSQYSNIIAEVYGLRSPDDIIVVGTHYDTVWMAPGADDNASGVAVLLELARELRTRKLDKTIRFVAFANEEWPHFLRKDMGSLFHAKRSFERGDKIHGMISLEMLGYYSDEPVFRNASWSSLNRVRGIIGATGLKLIGFSSYE